MRREWKLMAITAALSLAASGAVKVEKVNYKGWPNSYRVGNGEIELVVTGDVGPRIMHFGFAGGQNLLKEYPEQLGKSGEEKFQLRGGSRIWKAPEDPVATWAPDNVPVEVHVTASGLTAREPVEPLTGLQKEISVEMAATGTTVKVTYRIANKGLFPLEFSPWALTMMAQGGVAITGFPPRGKHPEVLEATNPLVMWAYTDLSDKRWTFTKKYVILRQDSHNRTPMKIGSSIPSNPAAFTFDIRTGASASADGTVVTNGSGTANLANGGIVTFGAKLDPAGTYQFCETNIPVAWSTTLSTLTGAFQPPNGGVNSTWCVPFGAGTAFTLTPGGTLTFTVDNTPPPSGGTRTIGYWKNWSSCDGKGKQAPSLDLALPQTVGDLLLAGNGTSPAAGCTNAVEILDKSTLDGKKMASDPAYNLAAQLLGAKLNVQAGAGTCPNSTLAIASAQALLDQINFNGTGSYKNQMTDTQIALAQTLASILDAYNQDNSVCASLPLPPSIVFTSASGTTISSSTGGTFTVTATANPGPAPTFSIVSAPVAGITINSTTGVLTVAAGTTPGTYTIKIAASSWGVVYQTFTLIVN